MVLSYNFAASAHAAKPESGCFDFDADWKPLQETRPHISASGNLAKGGAWAAAEDTLNRPIGEILDELKTHEKTKSSRIDDMEITPIPNPKYLALQRVHFEVHPFPLITVDWTEDWAFSLKSGSSSQPERVVVGYQKVDGTSHIKHLCGSYILTRKSPGTTEVQLEEESQATQHSREDLEKGVRGTIEALGHAH